VRQEPRHEEDRGEDDAERERVVEAAGQEKIRRGRMEISFEW